MSNEKGPFRLVFSKRSLLADLREWNWGFDSGTKSDAFGNQISADAAVLVFKEIDERLNEPLEDLVFKIARDLQMDRKPKVFIRLLSPLIGEGPEIEVDLKRLFELNCFDDEYCEGRSEAMLEFAKFLRTWADKYERAAKSKRGGGP